MKKYFVPRVLGIALLTVAAILGISNALQSQALAPWTLPIYINNGSPQPVTSSSGLPVQCLSGCIGSSGAPAVVTCASPACVVTTPVPAPTDLTQQSIKVFPEPSVSPGFVGAIANVGPSPGSQAGFSGPPGTNIAAVDSNGHSAVNVCSATSVPCVTLVTGTNSMMLAGLVGITKTELTAAAATCTLLSASAAVIVIGVMYPAGTAQTGQLDLYDVGSAVCTGAYFYENKARASSVTAFDPIDIKVGTGLAYQWTTNAEVGHVYVLTI